MPPTRLYSWNNSTETFWVDNNLNKWNHKDYSYDGALACSMSLEGCYDCINCQDCINCNHCIDCSNCTNCIECINCFKCSYCNVIENFKEEFGKGKYLNVIIKDNENYWIDINCNQWSFSYCLSYAEAIANYESLDDCKNCVNCFDCIQCVDCLYCESCTDLIHCSYCHHIEHEEHLNNYSYEYGITL